MAVSGWVNTCPARASFSPWLLRTDATVRAKQGSWGNNLGERPRRGHGFRVSRNTQEVEFGGSFRTKCLYCWSATPCSGMRVLGATRKVANRGPEFSAGCGCHLPSLLGEQTQNQSGWMPKGSSRFCHISVVSRLLCGSSTCNMEMCFPWQGCEWTLNLWLGACQTAGLLLEANTQGLLPPPLPTRRSWQDVPVSLYLSLSVGP